MSKSKSLSAALAAVFMSVAAASLATTPANAATSAREHHAASRQVVLSTSALAFERDLPGIARGNYSSRFASHDGEFDYRRYWPYHAYYDYCAAHVADSGNGC